MTHKPRTRPGRVLVGNCSWTDPTLIASGGFYPAGVSSAAARLAYYATQFPIVEVDATFYAPPDERNAERWAARTPPGFVFDVKAFALLTGHGAAPERLTPELQACLATDVAGKRNVYLRDLGAQAEELLYETHRRALAPLHATGKLGAVLLQFPPWFRAGHEGREHIRRAVRELAPYRVAVEFRGGGWLGDDAAAAGTLSFLESAGASYVSVDEPQGFPNSTPPLSAATSTSPWCASTAATATPGRSAAGPPPTASTTSTRPVSSASGCPRSAPSPSGHAASTSSSTTTTATTACATPAR